MTSKTDRTAKTIRLREEAHHRARIAALASRKSLGQWLEEAIEEKLVRDLPPGSGEIHSGYVTKPSDSAAG